MKSIYFRPFITEIITIVVAHLVKDSRGDPTKVYCQENLTLPPPCHLSKEIRHS